MGKERRVKLGDCREHSAERVTQLDSVRIGACVIAMGSFSDCGNIQI